jgi:hypothetical protein
VGWNFCPEASPHLGLGPAAGGETDMNELVTLVQQKTGISQEMAQQVVDVVVSHLKNRLPAPMAAGIDSLLAGGQPQAPGEGGGLMERAESMVGGLMGNKES